jgi:hypothetical protein
MACRAYRLTVLLSRRLKPLVQGAGARKFVIRGKLSLRTDGRIVSIPVLCYYDTDLCHPTYIYITGFTSATDSTASVHLVALQDFSRYTIIPAGNTGCNTIPANDMIRPPNNTTHFLIHANLFSMPLLNGINSCCSSWLPYLQIRTFRIMLQHSCQALHPPQFLFNVFSLSDWTPDRMH